MLSSNCETKFADWVAYQVTRETIGKSKTRNWKPDPDLPEDRTLEPPDYKDVASKLKSDRGHQAPLAALSGTQYWYMTNYLSNTTPQKAALNQGPWERLEEAERNIAQARGAIFVVTGPLYERDIPSLPGTDEAHVVPSAYWKVLAVESGGSIRVAAFYFDQETARGEDYCDHLTTVDEVEDLGGPDLVSQLVDQQEESIESGSPSLSGELGCAP